LGTFIPLIVVNCIIMGRVEAFASKNTVGDSILDALGMGLGYTWVLTVISVIREIFGGGTLLAGTPFQLDLIPEAYRIGILNSAPGGFLVFGCLMALMNAIANSKKNKGDVK
jgi:Na+-translocating ferredoxin:NAD+ oxidoreductase subunit E